MSDLVHVLFRFLLPGWMAAALLMTALWFRQRRTGNAGVVDAGWAAAIAALAVAYSIASDADPFRRGAVAAMGGLWGARLAWHIHQRSRGRPEDGRYTALRREWGPDTQRRMFFFFQLQAAAAAFFSLAFIPPLLNRSLSWSGWELAGMALWALAVAGESLADVQLERFKRRPENRGRTCRDGLWRYSRHPNYFFEWLAWCGCAIFAWSAPLGWLALPVPLALLHLIMKVTGIPATEAQALRTKGDDYRAYQRETSAFLPWFPRRKELTDVVRTAA